MLSTYILWLNIYIFDLSVSYIKKGKTFVLELKSNYDAVTHLLEQHLYLSKKNLTHSNDTFNFVNKPFSKLFSSSKAQERK